MTELDLYKREHASATKKLSKVMNIINADPPHKEYFDLVEQIKNIDKDINNPVLRKLLKRGAELERNLVKLTKAFYRKQEKAWEDRLKLEEYLSMINNNLYYLRREEARDEQD